MIESTKLPVSSVSWPLEDEAILPAVYDELRQIASAKLANEKPGQTFQPTALVHEVWLKLSGSREGQPQQWDSRGQFFAAATEAMRCILIDVARRKSAKKRNGSLAKQNPASLVPLAEASLEELIDLNEAIDRLAVIDSVSAELVKLRLFSGLTVQDAATVLEIPVRTAYRTWSFAQTWLYSELKQ